jgi:hypothetical protein
MSNPLHRTAAPSPNVRGANKLIETERKRLFAELTMLRELRGPSAHAVETAQRLLTRWWAKANWRTRVRLLKAADWLIHLEHNRDVQSPA